MPEFVTVREHEGIIQIVSIGDVSEQELHHSLERVLKLKQNLGLTRVLVDATEQVSLPRTASLYWFGSKLSSEALDMRHAIVVTRDQMEDLRFVWTVGQNRGLQIQLFVSRDDAVSWLKE